jgi:hypothetical protein
MDILRDRGAAARCRRLDTGMSAMDKAGEPQLAALLRLGGRE